MSSGSEPGKENGLDRPGQKLPHLGLIVSVCRRRSDRRGRENPSRGKQRDFRMAVLAPSEELWARFRRGEIRFAQFSTQFRREMRRPLPQRMIRWLAQTSRDRPLFLECECAEAKPCYCEILRSLIQEQAAGMGGETATVREYSSPACSMPEVDD